MLFLGKVRFRINAYKTFLYLELATTVAEYVSDLPENRKTVMTLSLKISIV
jgi:hypothetical protein